MGLAQSLKPYKLGMGFINGAILADPFNGDIRSQGGAA
jgi:hypothetical protein